MSQNPIETVEIVEPPIGELTKRHGGLKRSCFTGCGCLFLFIIALIVGIKLFIGSGPATIATLPTHFPKEIPIYDRDNIDAITYISGTYKSRSMEIAGLFPKFILSPLLLKLDSDKAPTAGNEKQDTLGRLWNLITTPVGDSRDTIHIEWSELKAEPSFVVSYYQTELRKQGYTTTLSNTNGTALTFEKNLITGNLTSEKDTTVRNNTSYAVLTVNYPTTPTITSTVYHAE